LGLAELEVQLAPPNQELTDKLAQLLDLQHSAVAAAAAMEH
jgi:hypothetical protein